MEFKGQVHVLLSVVSYIMKMLVSMSTGASFQLIFILGNHGGEGMLLSCRNLHWQY